MQRESVAVVTGSSSGNGFETSLLLAKNGFYTYATMRNLDKSTRMKEVAKKDSLQLEVLQLDVTDDKSVTDAIDMISNRHGRIDVLVNNAGYDHNGAVEELSMEEIIDQLSNTYQNSEVERTLEEMEVSSSMTNPKSQFDST